MKRTLIILFVLVSLSLTAQHKPFQFGFKAGANIGWFNTSAENYNNIGADFGGSWGFVADFFIMENYSFTTGFDVLYLNGTMSYPAEYKYDTSSYPLQGNRKRSYRTKYIKIPFVLTMKTNEIKKLRYYGQIGFGLNILISAKAKDEFTADDGSDVITDENNIYNELRFTRESLILGAGVEVPMQGSTFFRIGITYDNAFIDILKGQIHTITTIIRTPS